jgi:hypothetical protein
MKIITGLLAIIFTFLMVMGQDQDDRYIWLEEVEGDSAMAWVLAQNKISIDAIQAHPDFEKIKKNILDVLNSKERIPYPTIHGKYVTNFWQDEKNERGLWRRTTLENYLQDSVQWETLLDLDALSAQEGENGHIAELIICIRIPVYVWWNFRAVVVMLWKCGNMISTSKRS